MKLAIEICLLVLVAQAIYDFNTGPMFKGIGDGKPEAIAATGNYLGRHQWFQFLLAMSALAALVALEIL